MDKHKNPYTFVQKYPPNILEWIDKIKNDIINDACIDAILIDKADHILCKIGMSDLVSLIESKNMEIIFED